MSNQVFRITLWIHEIFSELRENLSRIGANLKQKFVESVKETWASINDFARAHTGVQSSDEHDSPGARKDASDTESQSKCYHSVTNSVFYNKSSVI